MLEMLKQNSSLSQVIRKPRRRLLRCHCSRHILMILMFVSVMQLPVLTSRRCRCR